MPDVILPANTAGDGVTTLFASPVPFIDQSHIRIYVDGVLQVDPDDYSWSGASSIQFVSAPADGADIEWDRETPTTPLVNFVTGALSPSDMNKATRQGLYVAHEARSRVATAETNITALEVSQALQDAAIALLQGGVIDGIFTPTGTGGVARTVNAKLEELGVYVTDYGAVGDCTGVGVGTDDSAAILRAMNVWKARPGGTLIFPPGRYRMSSGVSADLNGSFGHNVIMFGSICPDTSVARAVSIYNGYNFSGVFRVYGGGALADYTEMDPAGGTEAFYIRALRTATLEVYGQSYLGRVLRITRQQGAEAKTSKIEIKKLVTGDINSPFTRCGQSLCWDDAGVGDSQGAQGGVTHGLTYWDYYGPLFEDVSDMIMGTWEASFRNIGFMCWGVQGWQMDKFYVGDTGPSSWQNSQVLAVGDLRVDETTETLWEVDVAHTAAASGTFGDDRTANPTYWTNTGDRPKAAWQIRNSRNLTRYWNRYSVGQVKILKTGTGIDAVGAGANSPYFSLHVAHFDGRGDTNALMYQMAYLEDVRRAKINFFPYNVERCAKIAGTDSDDLEFYAHGRLINRDAFDIANIGDRHIRIAGSLRDIGTGYAGVKVAGTTTRVRLSNLDIIKSTSGTLLDVPASNRVSWTEGRGAATGSATNWTNRPAYIKDVAGIVTRATGTLTILNGATSGIITHGLAATPGTGGINFVARNSQVSQPFVNSGAVTSTQITVNVPTAVTADRDISWEANCEGAMP